MYRIFLEDGTLVYDSGSPLKEQKVLDPKLKLEDSSAGSLTFTILPNNPAYDAYEKMVTEIYVMRDNEEIWRGRVLSDDIDFYKQKKVECEGTLAYFNDTVQEPAQHQTTPKEFLRTLINNHNKQVRSKLQPGEKDRKSFELGLVTVTDANNYILRYTNFESTMKCINDKLLDNLGGHMVVRVENGVKYIDYLQDYPSRTSQTIDFGVNLLDYTQSELMDTLCTVIIPRGARLDENPPGYPESLDAYTTVESVNKGSKYVINETAVRSKGWVCKVVDWDDVTEPSRLLTKAKEYISDLQFSNVSLEVTALDLSLMNPEIESIDLLDEIRCISEPHGMDRYFPVTKIELNLESPENSVYTFGTNYKRSFTSETKTAINGSEKKAAKSSISRTQASDIIKAKTNGYITIIDTNNESGGHTAELVVSDTPDYHTARKVWRWNVNGLGYSNTGYNGEYGLALTMDGHFVADAIAVDGLEVGKNVTMGKDAYITWDQVSDVPDDIAYMDDIPTSMDWGQVTDKPSDLAYTKDIPTAVADLTDGSSYAKKTEVPKTVAELTDSGDYALVEYVDGKVPKKVSDLTDGDMYALKTYVNGAFTELEPIYYLSTSKPSAPTSKVTSTATSANQWTKVLPTYVNGYYYWTCNQSTTKGGTTTWTPVVMYTQSDVVTKITKDTVTTSYVNALNVTAGHVACEHLTGNTITGKKFDGGSIRIGTNDQFVVDSNGNVTSKHLHAETIQSHGNVSFQATDTANGGIYSNANIYGVGVVSGANGMWCGRGLYVEDNVSANSCISRSDRRLKEDIVELPTEDATRLLTDVCPKYYKLKADPSTERMGFIAQEIQDTLKKNELDDSLLVVKTEDPRSKEEWLNLNYSDFIAVLVKGWQKHEEEIKALKAEIAELKGA